MKKILFPVLAATLLMAACETASDSQNVNVGTAAAPGTAADFKNNIKDRVFFAYDKSTISADAKKVLEAQAAWLKTYGTTTVTEEGKTDPRGTAHYNMALGARRAEAAKKALVAAGVDANRIKTMSLGKEKLEVMGDTEEANAQNRVAITVIN
jgi:peptidoglycan-associated lipoprotein